MLLTPGPSTGCFTVPTKTQPETRPCCQLQRQCFPLPAPIASTSTRATSEAVPHGPRHCLLRPWGEGRQQEGDPEYSQLSACVTQLQCYTDVMFREGRSLRRGAAKPVPLSCWNCWSQLEITSSFSGSSFTFYISKGKQSRVCINSKWYLQRDSESRSDPVCTMWESWVYPQITPMTRIMEGITFMN